MIRVKIGYVMGNMGVPRWRGWSGRWVVDMAKLDARSLRAGMTHGEIRFSAALI